MLHKNSIYPLLMDKIINNINNNQFLNNFMFLTHVLNMYKSYSYNYKHSEVYLNSLRNSRHPFIAKMELIENTEEFYFYDLNYLIYYPIARIFHYKNTFQDMAKNCKVFDANFTETRKTLSMIKSITNGIDRQLENVDFSNDLY